MRMSILGIISKLNPKSAEVPGPFLMTVDALHSKNNDKGKIKLKC